MMEKFGVSVKGRLMYKARKKAREDLDGANDESYKLIPAYMEVLKLTNPGSVCHYVSVRVEDKDEFKYCFISYKCMFEGFSRGCRPLIGVDGCHMKGAYGGVVLSAIAFDDNHQLFPIAFAIARAETIDSWTYFMRMLRLAINNVEESTLTFISDRQKGVERAITDVFPTSTKRHCCRHLYANFCKSHPAPHFKVLFWQAARTKSDFVFEKPMNTMRSHSPDAYQYLMEIPLEAWAAFKFDKSVSCDENTSNFVESFNSTLGLDRTKPIIPLLEGIRRACMIRVGTRQALGGSWSINEFCPNTKHRLRNLTDESRFCHAIRAGRGEFEVRDGQSTLSVNINNWECQCGAWQITGVPCKHAIRALVNDRLDVNDYINSLFSVVSYRAAYRDIIHPVPDSSNWPTVEANVLHPPTVTRRIGWPAKQRRLEEGEKMKGKRSVIHKCSICGKYGHNKKGCRGGSTTNERKEDAKKRKASARSAARSAQYTQGAESSANTTGAAPSTTDGSAVPTARSAAPNATPHPAGATRARKRTAQPSAPTLTYFV